MPISSCTLSFSKISFLHVLHVLEQESYLLLHRAENSNFG